MAAFNLSPQLFETVAFAFSIMAVIGGVSSTLSFGLVSGTAQDDRPLLLPTDHGLQVAMLAWYGDGSFRACS